MWDIPLEIFAYATLEDGFVHQHHVFFFFFPTLSVNTKYYFMQFLPSVVVLMGWS